jgi:hypothetical protein
MRDDAHAVGIRVGGDLQEFRQPPAESQIGLDDVHASLDEAPEPIATRLVLTRRKQDSLRLAAGNLDVAPGVIGIEWLLHPEEVQRDELAHESERVLDIEPDDLATELVEQRRRMGMADPVGPRRRRRWWGGPGSSC